MASATSLVTLEDLKAAYDTQYQIITSEWSSSTTYNAGDYCIYEGDLWRCKVDGLSGNNNYPRSGQNWADCTAMGQIKVIQENIAPRFSESSTYDVGDYVTHEHHLYRCKSAVTSAGSWTGTGNDGNWTELNTDGLAGQLDRLWYDVALAWQPDHAYKVGDYCTYNKHFYRMSIQPAQDDHTWNANHWDLVDDISNDIMNMLSTWCS